MKRRDFLKWVSGGMVINAAGLVVPRVSWSDTAAENPALPSLAVLPGKKPLLVRTFRPPNYETPLRYFNEIFTPNDAFFVRYHLADIPQVDARTWKLQVAGDAVDKPQEFTLDGLKKQFETVEVAAVNQCAGNRRMFAQPRVPGVQWGTGAMGNARWQGVRLKDVLDKAGVKKNALEVAFAGADRGVLAGVPDFAKSLPVEKALDENTLIAFAMNGEPLPQWNGYPARLVVPGWVASYWLKHLNAINVITKPFDSFWMQTAYRIPKGTFPNLASFTSQESGTTAAITEIVINSLVTNIEDGQIFKLGHGVDIKGIAWDGGHGIKQVQVSTAGGKNWQLAELGKDYGRFSWRPWQFRFKPRQAGPHQILVKAMNRNGAVQPLQAVQNPGGYHHNQVQTITIRVV